MAEERELNGTVTQADVARAAGVSRTTVSYVLSNSQQVAIPEETRRRIWEVVRELGYVPNRAAQSLRTQKTYTIASIIEDIANPFHPAFERGIQDVAERFGYDLIMYNTDGDPAKERKALASALRSRVDGVIGSFFGMTETDFLPLLKQNVPMVWLTGHRPPLLGEYALDTVYVDGAASARAAVLHLIERGHRRIAMLAGQPSPRYGRIMGYRQALEENGISVDEALVYYSPFSLDGGKAGMTHLLTLDPLPTAVFAASDLLAIGAMIILREAGIRIPDQIAIVGYDNIFAAELVTPPLTTIALFQQSLGNRAAEMLFERLQGAVVGAGRIVEMPYELIIRASG